MMVVKVAYQKHGISMPDEAREVVFPRGILVTVLDAKPSESHAFKPVKGVLDQLPGDEPNAPSTTAEGGSRSDAGVIEAQARNVKPLNDGEDLLNTSAAHAPNDEKATNPPRRSENSSLDHETLFDVLAWMAGDGAAATRRAKT